MSGQSRNLNSDEQSVRLTCNSDDAEGQKVKLFCAFSDDRWTANRSVTDLDWSPKVSKSRLSV